ncbi:MAG: hypothetical protein M1818_005543 [Claussenomyces sp. TS43310]|nr:MAG: hypothetical protein M1818_005543 [Claussenomyces sp. TS43310]
MNAESLLGDDDLAAEVDEPPEHHRSLKRTPSEFQKSAVNPQNASKQSLLTRAFTCTAVSAQTTKPQIRLTTDMQRRRSTMSTASATSTADLTSDGGVTSPARTNTPSPPFPATTYTSFVPYTLGPKPSQTSAPSTTTQESNGKTATQPPRAATESKPDPAVEALVRKRCISFACSDQKPRTALPTATRIPSPEKEAPKRTIKFACVSTKSSDKPQPVDCKKVASHDTLKVTPESTGQRNHSRSPSASKKLKSTPTKHKDTGSAIRRFSRSPVALRNRQPKYIAVDERAFQPSEATRFHEFASDGVEEDDWIRRDASETKQKLTINDTLKKENAIRRLGEEAEEEALQDEEEEKEKEEGDYNDDVLDDSEDNEDEEDIDEEDEFDDETIDGSDDNASDGNETDNEAGFADSDDESDAGRDYQFWTPGRPNFDTRPFEATTFRSSAHRTASESSIDSLKHMSPIAVAMRNGRRPRARRIRIRPGTPDLPDSTDFVCGTLDEDRPLEDAYVSCMEARKREKHYTIPQDIDPSFPTSDLEEEEEEEDDDDDDVVVEPGRVSEEDVWLHGKFEDSDDSGHRNRRRFRQSPNVSPRRLRSPPPQRKLHSPPPPRRLHSPPPPTKIRYRSPPPPPPAKIRYHSPPPPSRLFGGISPTHAWPPPTAYLIPSPPASPTNKRSAAITFEPLGRRPGLTHTKSLPRTPNAFCRAYRASRLVAANGNIADGSDIADGHTRGAIDIVKGLEHKRQRRKEKWSQKHCNRARKGLQVDRRPLPGKGAERMRELGLQMAGKTDTKVGMAEYVLSV